MAGDVAGILERDRGRSLEIGDRDGRAAVASVLSKLHSWVITLLLSEF